MGLLPPEGVHGADQNRILPNPIQQVQFGFWERFWTWATDLKQAAQADGIVAFVGDLFEGNKFAAGAQIISPNHEPQAYIADRVIGKDSVIANFAPIATAVIRGTEAHVGPVGESEEAFGRRIKSVQRPDGAWSWWVWKPEIHGVLGDFRHHPSNYGTKPWTDKAAIIREAKQVFYAAVEHGLRAPQIAIRGHVHYYADSYDACPTRAIFLPPWQEKTTHGHKVASNAIGQHGGVAIIIEPNSQYHVEKQIYQPEEPAPWHLPTT